jgi:ribonuclease HI
MIWQLNIPNVEKHFLWRACHDILPTRVNLCARKIITDPLCLLCEREPETAFHILWQCPSAGDVWGAGGKVFQKSSFKGPDFIQVVEEMLRKCDPEEFSQFVGIARRIWLRRNEVMHGGSFQHPNSIVKLAQQATEVYQSLRNGRDVEPTVFTEVIENVWKAPSPGWFKANWDAGIDKKNGRVGLGVIIRNHRGAMVASKSHFINGVMDPTAAEAMAALMAVTFCVEMGIEQVVLEGDAKNVITAVNSDEPDESGRGQLTADICYSLRSIQVWVMRHTCREANKVAHAIANWAMSNTMNKVWLYDPPDCIRSFLQADFSAVQVLN